MTELHVYCRGPDDRPHKPFQIAVFNDHRSDPAAWEQHSRLTNHLLGMPPNGSPPRAGITVTGDSLEVTRKGRWRARRRTKMVHAGAFWLRCPLCPRSLVPLTEEAAGRLIDACRTRGDSSVPLGEIAAIIESSK